jgi:uncharacterized protein YqfA (UPF0365 family)
MPVGGFAALILGSIITVGVLLMTVGILYLIVKIGSLIDALSATVKEPERR